MSRCLAIIGTAGRDKTKVMDLALWQAMAADARGRVQPSDELVSGGAAWADHLAVHLFLEGCCQALTLYLPAPLEQVGGHWRFEEAGKGSGSAANWYHQQFSEAIVVDTMGQVATAIARGAAVDAEPSRPGYAGFFRRNKMVAERCTAVVAYTFADGDVPADGGTMDTWKQIQSADRTHVSLARLQKQVQQSAPRPQSRSERYR